MPAAIFFEPEGYTTSGTRLMGRQAAGRGFLRAAVAGRGTEDLWSYTADRNSAVAFAREVKAIDPPAEGKWCPAHRLDILEQIGTLYYPGPDLDTAARLRLRRGPAAYSLCGITHTTASHRAMDAMSALLTGPLMPWDALICTSTAVLETVRTHFEATLDYLKWRFGSDLAIPRIETPVIPLGVHSGDYCFTAEERAAARAAIGAGTDEIVVLYVGRLSFHAKAHPDAMYLGLEAAARASGRKVRMLHAGWFANAGTEKAFKDGAAAAAPSVTAQFVDGRDQSLLRQAWASADLFVSLSDNVQETFGLTPIEAMAAGLPVVVTDWNGYKDTVRDGIDGFRIATRMPLSGDDALALRHESGAYNYDRYCALACQTVAVDLDALTEKLTALLQNEELRRTMGEAGRQRAVTDYDWAVVFGQYRALWDSLRQARAAASPELLRGAPSVSPTRLAPSKSFHHYPTIPIRPESVVVVDHRVDGRDYAAVIASGLYSYADGTIADKATMERIVAACGDAMSIAELTRRVGIHPTQALLAASMLLKMGLLRLAV